MFNKWGCRCGHGKCWNVAGWSKGRVLSSVRLVDKHDFRAKVIEAYNPNMSCIVYSVICL